MASMEYWVWLSAQKLRPRAKQQLLDHFHDDPERIFFASHKELMSVEGLKPTDLERLGSRDLTEANSILEQCRAQEIRAVTPDDPAYPWRLKNIYDPPVVLYVKGSLPELDTEAAIAVVGTRAASVYGEKMALQFGRDIVRCGGVLVSGLNRGIDLISAEGALKAGGRVIGVLAGPIDSTRPENQRILAKGGALVSEYPPGQPMYKANFRHRNRITAALSAGVLVVEAPEQSGALLFAEEAVEQGKELYVVPGNADQSCCVGSNRLLKDGGIPVTEAWDILSHYAPRWPGKLHQAPALPPEEPSEPLDEEAEEQRILRAKYPDFVQVRVPNKKKVIDKPKTVEYIDLSKQLEGLTERQRKIAAALQSEPLQIDDLIAAVELDASTVLAELTMLQIRGVVQQTGGKRFTLNITRG